MPRTVPALAAQGAADRRELGVDRSAEGGYSADDDNADQAGDQAVFNSGCAGFVLGKASEKIFYLDFLASTF